MNTNEIFSTIEKELKQPLWSNWYIKERIGSGAFSAVYRIEAKRLNRTDVSALKIEPITAGDTLFWDEERKKSHIEHKRSLVENESTIMYKLKRCPYIVAYEEEDVQELIINGKFEGYYFLIRMELLTCVSDLIRNKKMDFSESNIIKLAKHIGQGIKAAHDIGIIHRDIKPANFFLSDDGTYKLGDFNVSKQSETARTFAGTCGYLAPEIYRAKSNVDESYTRQADIYSLGICLYQFMNDGYFPFEETYMIDTAIDKRMKGEKLLKPKNASEEFAKIILRACAFDVQDRYRTIDEMLGDLNDVNKCSTKIATDSTVMNTRDIYATIYATEDDINEIQSENEKDEIHECVTKQKELASSILKSMEQKDDKYYVNAARLHSNVEISQTSVNESLVTHEANIERSDLVDQEVSLNQALVRVLQPYMNRLMIEGYQCIYFLDSKKYKTDDNFKKRVDKKLRNAIKKYAAGAANEHIYLFCDRTLFGSAKDGFLLTDSYLYVNSYRIEISEIEMKIEQNENGYFLEVPYKISLWNDDYIESSRHIFNGDEEKVKTVCKMMNKYIEVVKKYK